MPTRGSRSDPRLAVLIVVHNHAPYLQKCLDSLVQAAMGVELRVVVHDCASTDCSGAVADAHPVVDVLVAGGNLGYGRGVNAAFAHVDDSWPTVLVLNPDTLLVTPLREVLDHADRLGEYGCIGIRQVAPDGRWVPSWDDFPRVGLEWRKAVRLPVRSRQPGAADADRRVDWVVGSFLILPRAVFERVGGFDPDYFLFYEEVDLCRRLAASDEPVWYVADAVYEHRQDGKYSRWREVARWQSRGTYDRRWLTAPARLACRLALTVRWVCDLVAPRRPHDRADAPARFLATWGLLVADLDGLGRPRLSWALARRRTR